MGQFIIEATYIFAALFLFGLSGLGAVLVDTQPDMQISRIRLSDKTSRLHPRRLASKRSQTYEPEVPVKVREWIGPAFASPDFVLGAQPPTQPHRGIAVNRPVRVVDGAGLEADR